MCFNGATAFQPWIPSSGFDFQNVLFSSFNGATAFQPWILGQAHRFLGRYIYVASMGPQLFSRGYHTTQVKMLAAILSFNGATAFQPWIRAEG